MAMSERNKRVVWILVAVLVAGGIVCLICGVAGLFRFQQFFGEAQEVAARTIPEADEFARTHDQAACRDEGLRRDDLCGPMDMMCVTQVSVFMQRCFDGCAATPGFCDGVPPVTDIMGSVAWQRAQCAALGRERDTRCPSLMQSVQNTCARPH